MTSGTDATQRSGQRDLGECGPDACFDMFARNSRVSPADERTMRSYFDGLARWPFLLLVGGVGACTTAPEQAAPGEGFDNPDADDNHASVTAFEIGAVSYHGSCSKTESERCSERCSECWDICETAAFASGSISCASTCDSVCDCAWARSDRCARWSQHFDFGPPDPDIERACLALATELSSQCGVSLSRGTCASFARAERAEAADAYRCASDKVGQGDCQSYDCGYPATDTGTRLCQVSIERCGTCPLDTDKVNENASWLREDVHNASFECLKLSSCAQSLACLAAWEQAAFPL